MTPDPKVFAFEVNVKGTNWQKVVNARTAGAAKYQYLLDVREAWPSVQFKDLTCRKLGAAQSSPEFLSMAARRGITWRCGDRIVMSDGDSGVIVGHNSSLNLDVLFDSGTRYAGQVLNVHPASCALEVVHDA